jgi:hypothetical protein
VFGAKFQVTRQFKQANSAEYHYKSAKQRHNDTGGNQPFTDLLWAKLDCIECRELSGIYRLN